MFTKKIMSRWGVAATSLAVFSVGLDADACSCVAGPHLVESLPVDGAQGVPTNVVPWLTMGGGGQARLLDDSQVEVPAKLKAVEVYPSVPNCNQRVEIVPEEELEPNTEYTVLLEGDDEGSDAPVSYSFTTGDGPLADEEVPAPSVGAGFFDAENYPSTCIHAPTQSCIAGDYEGLLEVRTFEDGAETSRYVDSLQEGILAHGGDAKEFCVEVRARDLAGRRSKAVSFCSSTESLYVLPHGKGDPACSSDLVEELNAENSAEDPAEVSSGCSIGKGPLRRNTWPGLLVTLLGGLLVGRRRKSAF